MVSKTIFIFMLSCTLYAPCIVDSATPSFYRFQQPLGAIFVNNIYLSKLVNRMVFSPSQLISIVLFFWNALCDRTCTRC